jgi:hypothetical protein
MAQARTMWLLFEPIHEVTYFHQRARERFVSAGLRGFWRGYFAGRSAPLGPVGAAPVIAAFYNFAPSMVSRALPDVWSMVSPEETLRVRAEGAVEGLTDVLAETPVAHVDEAAGLLETAVSALEPAGRVLGAANAALPAYVDPYARLFQATTTLREHRGDGHVAALVAANIGPLEVLALRCGLGHLSWDLVQPLRGWTDEEWSAAQARLLNRGWLDADGRATPVGAEAFAGVERATDVAAEAPWTALGAASVHRAMELLDPMAAACRALVPAGNPIGLPPHPTLPSPPI